MWLLHPWDCCFAKEQYFPDEEIVLLRNFKSNVKMFGVVSTSFAVLLVSSYGLFSEEQYEIKKRAWNETILAWSCTRRTLPKVHYARINWFLVHSATTSKLCSCYIPNVMAEIRYAGIDRAAGYWGILVRSLSGHLRIDINDNNHNPWRVEIAGLLFLLVDINRSNWWVALWGSAKERTINLEAELSARLRSQWYVEIN